MSDQPARKPGAAADLPSQAPDTEPRLPRGRPFPAGVSGNPAGRPKGSRNRLALPREEVEQALPGLIQMVLKKAQEGNLSAARLVLYRLAPRPGAEPLAIELPDTGTLRGVILAMGRVVQLVAAGELTLEEGEGLHRMLNEQREAHAEWKRI